jgi:hypothetical protein
MLFKNFDVLRIVEWQENNVTHGQSHPDTLLRSRIVDRHRGSNNRTQKKKNSAFEKAGIEGGFASEQLGKSPVNSLFQRAENQVPYGVWARHR